MAWFPAHGVTIARALTDNAKSYPDRPGVDRRLHPVRHRPSVHPVRPAQTNGKAERFHRTLQTEWAYAAWTGKDQRTAALDSWLKHYNTARRHSALGEHTPISRLAG